MKTILNERHCVALADLPPGQQARLCAHAGNVIPRRLRDLGFVPDTLLVVLRCAPLGDPFEVEIRGYRLCLRRSDVGALCVVLEKPEP